MILTLLLATLFAGLSVSAVDLTTSAKATGSAVVEATVDRIQQSGIFRNDKLLLRRIAAAETRDGLAAWTFTRNGADFYGGIWQVEELSFNISKQVAVGNFSTSIQNAFNINWSTVQYTDLLKPLYSALAARLKIFASYQNIDIPQNVTVQAIYWSTSYTTNVWSNAVENYISASLSISTTCTVTRADVVFVVDGSGSVLSSNFLLVKKFISDVVSSLVIGQQKVRVGLIEFSNYAEVQFNLSQYDNTSQVLAGVDAMPYFDSGTNSYLGLRAMASMIETEGRQSEGVSVVAVFLTDGQSNQPNWTVIEAADVHQRLPQVSIFAVGVGIGPVYTELATIASSPSSTYVYSLTGFADVTSFTDQLLKGACRAPIRLPSNDEIDAEVKKDQSYFFQLSLYTNESEVRIQLKVSNGGVRMYLSWRIQNPSSALYDTTVDVDATNQKGIRIAVQRPARAKRDATTAANETKPLYGAVVGMKDQPNMFSMMYGSSVPPPDPAASAFQLEGSVVLTFLAITTLLIV